MSDRSSRARAFWRYFEDPATDDLDQILTAQCAIHVAGPIGQALPKGPAGVRALNAATMARGTACNGKTVSCQVVWIFRILGGRIVPA